MIFLGDLHGNIKHIFYTLNRGLLDNKNIIQVGDFGIGFQSQAHEMHNLQLLDKALKLHNAKLWIMRGNHDDPDYFRGDLKKEINSKLENIVFVEDYEVHEIEQKNVIFVGGGISIDRTGRTQNVSYWKDEIVVYDATKIKHVIDNYENIDVIVTHSAPMWNYPVGVNSQIVRDWSSLDEELMDDLIDERENLSNIFDELDNKFKFKCHVYGHYHKNFMEQIVDCVHILIGIGEFIDISKYLISSNKEEQEKDNNEKN